MITITDSAAEKIRQFLTEDAPEGADGLRIRVVGGGCSGLQYKVDLSAEKKGDKVFEHGGARVYIDRRSFLYLTGTQLDYGDGLQGAGFQFNNPNVTKTCGCGESFMI
jgi:iron-sulfur cluster assembly protein